MDFLWTHGSPFILSWLVHSSWMGLVVGAGFSIGAIGLRERGAQSKYWWSVICLSFLAASTLVAAMMAVQFPPARTVHTHQRNLPSSVNPDTGPAALVANTNAPSILFDEVAASTELEQGPNAISFAAAEPRSSTSLRASPQSWTLPAWGVHGVALIYLTGATIMLMRLVLAGISSWRLISKSSTANESVLRAARQAANRLGIIRLPSIKVSPLVMVPSISGILQPVVLLPISLATQLTTTELQAILIHELAHFRRHDHWILIVQRAVETCLFFHPVVWIISRSLERQRELSCDDCVLNVGVTPAIYAQSLIHTAAVAISGRNMKTVVNAVGTKPSFLKQRIERIIAGPIIATPTPTVSWSRRPGSVLGRPVSAVAVLAALGLGVAFTLFGASTRTTAQATLARRSPVGISLPEQMATDTFPTLDGVVRDQQGNPLAGVAVMMQEHPRHGINGAWVIRQEQWSPKPNVAILKQVVTDEQGRFRFSDVPVPVRSSYIDHPWPVTIVAIHPKLALAWKHVRFRSSTDPIELELSAPSATTVSVHSDQNRPISNLKTRLICCLDLADWERNKQHRNAGQAVSSGLRTFENINALLQIQVTDNEISIPQVPDQMVAVLHVQCDNHVPTICYVSNISTQQRKKGVHDANLFNGQTRTEFQSPLVSPAQLEVAATVDLKLALGGPGDSPLTDTQVTTTEGELLGTSNDRGEVVLNDINPLKPKDLIIRPPLEKRLQSQRVELRPEDIHSQQPIEISLAPGRLLAGRILDTETQSGVPNAKVRFGSTMLSEPNAHLETESASDGSFQMIVPDQPGVAFVNRLDGYQIRDARVTIASDHRDQPVFLNVQKQLPRTRRVCRFKMVDEHQKPVVGARVRFFQVSSGGSYGQLDSVRTGAEGYLDVAASELFGRDREFVMLIDHDKDACGAIYRFNRPDQIKTWADSEQYIRKLASTLATDAPVMSTEIVLKPLLTHSGTIVDKKTDQPLANALVSLTQLIKHQEARNGPSVVSSVLTNRDGEYLLGGFSNTPKTISVFAKDYRNGSGKNSIAANGNSDLKHRLVHQDESHNIDPVVETRLGKPLLPTHSFQVTIVDYESGEPVTGAKFELSVKIDGNLISLPPLFTDQQGRINLSGVPNSERLQWRINHDGYHDFGWRPAYPKNQELELLSTKSYQRTLQIGKLQLPDTADMTDLQTIRRLARSFERSVVRNRKRHSNSNRPDDPMQRFVLEMKHHPDSLYRESIERIAYPVANDPVDRDAQFEALKWLLMNKSNEPTHWRTTTTQRRPVENLMIHQFADHPDIASVFTSLNNSSTLSTGPSWTDRRAFFVNVADANPNRLARGHAIYQLAQLHRTISHGWGLTLSVRPEGVKAMQETQRGYLEQLVREFADVKYASTTLGEIAKSDLDVLAKFGIGATPPNLAIAATKNQQLKLHDLRGRYILIHYWNGYDEYPQSLLPLTRDNTTVQLVTVVRGTKERVADLTAGWQTPVIVEPVRSQGLSYIGYPTPSLMGYAKDQSNILIDPAGKVASTKLDPNELTSAVQQILGSSSAK